MAADSYYAKTQISSGQEVITYYTHPLLGIFKSILMLSGVTYQNIRKTNWKKYKEFLAIRRAISLNETFVLFC